jgi:hypothetical protein
MEILAAVQQAQELTVAQTLEIILELPTLAVAVAALSVPVVPVTAAQVLSSSKFLTLSPPRSALALHQASPRVAVSRFTP